MGLTIKEAANLLGIAADTSIDGLHRSFRLLARQYHPDTMPTREDQQNAHEIMVRLTEARSLLEGFFLKNGSFIGLFTSSPLKSDEKAQNDFPYKVDKFAEDTEAKTGDTSAIFQQWENSYLNIREQGKEAIYIYYKYNLHRPHLRIEPGIKSFFREYSVLINESLYNLTQLLQKVESWENKMFNLAFHDEKTQTNIRIYYEYLRAFSITFNFYETFSRSVHCRVIMDFHQPLQEREIYMVYKQSSEAIDDALREIFIRKIEGFRPKFDLIFTNLQTASLELSHLLKNYPGSSWYEEIQTKGELILASLQYIKEFYQ